MKLREDALNILEATSRTFFIPISRLPPTLQEAVGAAYLCMRAIDEIEDDPDLDGPTKARLLRSIARTYEAGTPAAHGAAFCGLFEAVQADLAEVTARLGDWNALAPGAIAPRIFDATAAMADRMAGWAECGWQVRSEADLDRYTYGVAGAVGLLLSDIWAWFDGTATDRARAVGFGRGLQAVNILRNRGDDVRRGVDFFPDGWTDARMFAYARRNLELAAAYIGDLPAGPVRDFCSLPHSLANATLGAIAGGQPKLSREQVRHIASR
ncbi:MAG TPA: phytoene/squalene synthase family protein [Trueperaceae bacterium]|nr:phytoene/squalene synthase family protein [Trueperaceae bacterium]